MPSKPVADVDEIVFGRKSGDYPVVTADPYLEQLCVRRNACWSSIEGQVENAIAVLLPHGEMNRMQLLRNLA